jgi:hypothetical protein
LQSCRKVGRFAEGVGKPCRIRSVSFVNYDKASSNGDPHAKPFRSGSVVLKRPFRRERCAQGRFSVDLAGKRPTEIGHHAIADQVIPVEQAIRSASGLPADVLHLPERGYLKPGYFADVVLLDPETYRDRATYDKARQHFQAYLKLAPNDPTARGIRRWLEQNP